MMGEIILNLGSGSKVAADEIGVDILPEPGVGVVCNLDRYPLPFRTASVDRIRTHHCLEHLRDLVGVMEEVHRVLKAGGVLEVVVPHFGHIGFWRDPTHTRPFTYGTFDYFVRGKKPVAYTPVEFEYVKRELRFGSGPRAFLGKLLAGISVRRWEKYYRTAFAAQELIVHLKSLPTEKAPSSR